MVPARRAAGVGNIVRLRAANDSFQEKGTGAFARVGLAITGVVE
jgi:hypothetical protein